MFNECLTLLKPYLWHLITFACLYHNAICNEKTDYIARIITNALEAHEVPTV